MTTISRLRFFSRLQRIFLAAVLGCLFSLSAPAQQQLAGQGTLSKSKPKIQLAILLDTSGSMDGLIDQARSQLWQVVNEFSQTTRNGVSPALEVAVYEYGNDTLSAQSGYVRKVSDLTSELDQVSEALFSLTTNGGSEYCGYVIDNAARNLQWSRSESDIKVIFIAGNEPFTQGPVPYGEAIRYAKSKGIIVNTIHAGSYDEGAGSGWKEGAVLAGGNYMSIDHNYQIAHIVAPQDQRITELNRQLNNTYIPYGTGGVAKAERQAKQDAQSEGVSLGLLTQRIQSKVSSLYNNANWDLVDALENGDVKLDAIEDEALPAPMREMSLSDRKNYVEKNAEQRNQIQEEIIELSQAREKYVAEQKAKSAEPDVATIDKAFVSTIENIGKQKGFEFKSR